MKKLFLSTLSLVFVAGFATQVLSASTYEYDYEYSQEEMPTSPCANGKCPVQPTPY